MTPATYLVVSADGLDVCAGAFADPGRAASLALALPTTEHGWTIKRLGCPKCGGTRKHTGFCEARNQEFGR